jgi:glycosyltransferase involved in cell wall biosynthesis
VVIATRDRWPLLSTTALRSALRQQGVSWEVVVVDDGSSDGTAERVIRIGDPRVRTLRHERPLGVAAARNTGIEVSRGRWIAFLDDDDLWSPHKLQRQLVAAARVSADFVYGRTIVIDDARRVLFVQPLPSPAELPVSLRQRNVVGPPSAVMATRCSVVELGGFDDQLALLADWDLWIRLVERFRGAACRAPVVAYMQHATNMSGKTGDAAFTEFAYLREKHSSTPFDSRNFSRWIWHEQARVGHHWAATRTFMTAAARERSPRLALEGARTVLASRAPRLRARLGRSPDEREEPPPGAEWLTENHQ